jgi:hypothetical protein
MLSPEIADELRLANFPRWGMHFGPPALSELIGTCEDENPTGEFVLNKVVHGAGDFKWLAYFNKWDGSEPVVGEGKRPDEAVARLWLALHRSEDLTPKPKAWLLALEAEASKSSKSQEWRDEPEIPAGRRGDEGSV